MYNINDLPKSVELGRQGENKINNIVVDCSEWLTEYPGAILAATFIPPGKLSPVPLPVVINGMEMTIIITRNATRYDGQGSIVIQMIGPNDEEKRSDIIYAYIEKGHGPADGEAPEPVQDWLNMAIRRLNELDGIEAQNLAFDKSTSILSISGGNEVELNKGLTVAQYNHLSEIMARPYGTWILVPGDAYYNAPGRDIDNRKKLRIEWGLGILHFDYFAAKTEGIIGTIPAPTPGNPSPKAEVLIEVQAHDGATVWIDPNSRIVRGQGMTVGERYLLNLIGFFIH